MHSIHNIATGLTQPEPRLALPVRSRRKDAATLVLNSAIRVNDLSIHASYATLIAYLVPALPVPNWKPALCGVKIVHVEPSGEVRPRAWGVLAPAGSLSRQFYMQELPSV